MIRRPRVQKCSSCKPVRSRRAIPLTAACLSAARAPARRLVLFEDPQCPYCREFEDVSGDLLRREVSAGAVAVEYRIRAFSESSQCVPLTLWPPLRVSVGLMKLRRAMFANQPPEHSGGFTTEDLLELGSRVGLHHPRLCHRGARGSVCELGPRYGRGISRARPGWHPIRRLRRRAGYDAETLYDPDALGTLIRR